MKIDFRLTEQSKANTIWLKINFGGDADTEHPEYIKFDLPFSEYENHLDEIEEIVNEYKTLKKILDVNSSSMMYCESYKEALEKHGEKMAKLFDNVPNDPQADFQFKCSLAGIELVAYDKESNEYTSYIF